MYSPIFLCFSACFLLTSGSPGVYRVISSISRCSRFSSLFLSLSCFFLSFRSFFSYLFRAPYRGLFPSPPLFDRMPTYRTQGKRSLNFLSAGRRCRPGALPAAAPAGRAAERGPAQRLHLGGAGAAATEARAARRRVAVLGAAGLAGAASALRI